VLISIPISSATLVADFPFSMIKAAVCSLISSEYFDLLLDIVLLSFFYAYGNISVFSFFDALHIGKIALKYFLATKKASETL